MLTFTPERSRSAPPVEDISLNLKSILSLIPARGSIAVMLRLRHSEDETVYVEVVFVCSSPLTKIETFNVAEPVPDSDMPPPTFIE